MKRIAVLACGAVLTVCGCEGAGDSGGGDAATTGNDGSDGNDAATGGDTTNGGQTCRIPDGATAVFDFTAWVDGDSAGSPTYKLFLDGDRAFFSVA